MHELPITQSVLELALQHAARAGGGRITDLYLVVGKLSGVVDASVQFYWDILTEDTPAADSRLHFRHTEARMRCTGCGCEFAPEEGIYACTACGSPQVKVIAGEEFQLEAIDVEPDEDPGQRTDDPGEEEEPR